MRYRTLSAFVLSAFSALLVFAGAQTAAAWDPPTFTSVSVSPNSVELHAGETATVYFQGPSDVNDLSVGACTVNNVDVASSFQGLTDGLYRVTYTVGASDADRAAGQLPISCTINNGTNDASTTVTAFTDSNTLSINASGTSGNNGGDTGGSNTPPNGGLTVTANPSSGTLHDGDTLHITFGDPSGTTDAVADSCSVNGVDVKNSFHNVSAGVYQVDYTVGASDADRSAGQVPVDCTVHQAVSVHIDTFTDNNTVAIDASATNNGGNGGNATTTAPVLASTTIVPSSGMIHAGQTAHITMAEAHGFTDLTVMGTCKVNNVDVANTFQSLGGGQYMISYTVGQNDAERPAGWTLLDCTIGNANGTVTAHHPWTDNNTLAIDTNNDGTIDNGTSTLGFTTSANPSSGTLHAGDQLQVLFQDPLPSPDLVVGAGGCWVNGADVASTFTHTGNGLYRATYTVGQNDASQTAGHVPVNCYIQNNTGSVHLVAFTDNNTVAIDAAGNTGGNATSTISVGAVPSTGTLVGGNHLDVYFQAPHDQTNLALGGACRVNGVDVSSSFQNLTDGLYKVSYTVGSNDADRAAGHLPVSCVLSNGSTSTTLSAFTDSNTVAIDAGNDGTISEPTGNETPFISSVTVSPSTGTLHTGDQLQVSIQEGTNDPDYTVGTCTVNQSGVSQTAQNLGNGLYRVTYTVGSSDPAVSAGNIVINCGLFKVGSTLSVQAFTDNNTVAVDPTQNGGNNGGNNGTSTPSNLIANVGVVPSQGTVHAGSNVDVYFTAANSANDIALNGACTVNNVNVASSFQNLSGGLYKLLYTVGQNDTERSAGMLPIECMVRNGAGATSTVMAFTDSNTLAIDTNNDGVFGTSTDNGTGTTTGSIGGDVTGTTTDNGVLSVTSISQVQSQAIADGTFGHGWSWTFNVTVPTNETSFKMKFGNWSSGSNSMATANNMRISSEQATSSGSVMITAADSYSAPLAITGDMDPNMPGRQIQVKVEAQVPVGTANGSYTTTYGIMSTQ